MSLNWTAIAAVIAGIMLFASVTGAGITMLWRGASMLTKMDLALESLHKTIAEMREAMKDLQKIPDHERRILTLEGLHHTMAGQIGVILQKLGLHSGELRSLVRRASSPDLEKEKT